MIREDEIVVYPDMNKSDKEIKEQLEKNHQAKMRHAERKEREALEKTTLLDHFLNGVDRVKRVFGGKKNANQIKKANDRQR